MKKLIISFLLLVLSPIVSYADTLIKTETPLLPAVKQILEVPRINAKEMDQNAYVYFISFDAVDDNYLDMARQYLVKSNQWLIESMKDLNASPKLPKPELTYAKLAIERNINGKAYSSPCRDINNVHCVDDTLKQQRQLTALIDKNKKILARYEAIISLPDFHSYHELESGFFPHHVDYSYLSELRQSQAISLIHQGKLDEGFDILQKEIDFAKKIYTSKSHYIVKSIGKQKLLTLYHTIDNILDDKPELIKTNKPQLNSLLTSLPTQGQLNLEAMISYERSSLIYFQRLVMGEAKQSDEYKDLERLTIKKNIPFTFDVNKTLNNIYQRYSENSYLATSTPANLAASHSTIKQRKDIENCDVSSATFEQVFLKKYDRDNFLGDYIVCNAYQTRIVANKIFSLYDVQNYLALVNLKLEIKQNNIKAEQIAEFLANAGDKAINPYTQKPFVWNKDKLMLSTASLAISNPQAINEKENDLFVFVK